MNNFLFENDIFQTIGGKKVERILWIDPKYRYCFTIELNIKVLRINQYSIEELEKDLNSGIIKVCDEDPACKYISEENLGDKDRKIIEEYWSIIEFLMSDIGEPYIFDKNIRGKRVKQAVVVFKKTKDTIYKALRKYWQGGKLKSALISDYDKCGSNRKEGASYKKLGKPNALVKFEKNNNLVEVDFKDIEGINLDLKTKKILELAIKRYYLNQKEISLKKAYELMIMDFYSIDIDDNGNKKVLSANKIPTRWQFRYWFYKFQEKEFDNVIKKRKGNKNYNLANRGLTSNSVYESFGPGFRYQIDATITGVQLVNRLKNKAIGKPVVYFVIDAFSRMIVGVYVGLEGPSWNGATSAIYNCVEDKVKFCRRYGLDINPEEWLNATLPRVLIADRGEMAGTLAEKGIEKLKIHVENTPSWRADLKGAVEQSFNTAEINFKHWLPGAIKFEYRKRGEVDPKRDAKLNIIEFTRIVLRVIINHNHKILEDYIPTEEMINDNIILTPTEIWKWGLKNASGGLRKLPDDFVKINLMRRAQASVTEKGIKLGDFYYDCEKAFKEGWYSYARTKGDWSVDICLDQRDMGYIYIIDDVTGKFDICTLRKEYSAFNKKTYDEIKDYNNGLDILNMNLRDYTNQNDLDMNVGIRNDVKNAIKSFDEQYNNINDMVKDVNKNRADENESYRKEQALNLNDQENKNSIKDYEETKSEDIDLRSHLKDRLKKMKER